MAVTVDIADVEYIHPKNKDYRGIHPTNKQDVGRRLGSRATESEGAQNMICAYLSVALLVGLGANALLGWWWADPLSGLVIAAVAVREGLNSWRGDACGGGCC